MIPEQDTLYPDSGFTHNEDSWVILSIGAWRLTWTLGLTATGCYPTYNPLMTDFLSHDMIATLWVFSSGFLYIIIAWSLASLERCSAAYTLR